MPLEGRRPFVVVSGLPGSGKTTLARQLSKRLGLPLLDKDDILEALFADEGLVDVAARQRLSRASDRVLASLAAATQGAVLVSFWRHPGLDTDAGTPVDWLADLGGSIVEAHCDCPVSVAEQRFRARRRHPGHNDEARSAGLTSQFAALSGRGPLGIGGLVRIPTEGDYDLASIVRQVEEHFPKAP